MHEEGDIYPETEILFQVMIMYIIHTVIPIKFTKTLQILYRFNRYTLQAYYIFIYIANTLQIYYRYITNTLQDYYASTIYHIHIVATLRI